ncbi:protein lin-28 homolog A-like [Montipora foliosa]|uniref:protein lin-28 homolog A-like n=1 Tax=Montipora foliosa TaxID=591990 RepID=UPI0035F1D5F1
MYQTSTVEAKHSLLLLGNVYECLSALHYNENADRMQPVTIDGRPRYAIQFPKAKKGQPTVREIKTKPTYDGRRRKLNNETSSNRGKKKRCYNCDGFGHMAKVCPSEEGEMEKLQCYHCRGWGHKKSLCPTPRPRPQQKAAKQQEKQDEPANGKNVFYIYNQ